MPKRTFVSSHTYRGIWLIFPFVPTIFWLFIGLEPFVCTNPQKLVVEDPDYLCAFLLGLAFMTLATAMLANAYPNIKVYKEGLEIQYFWIFWLFVPWEDVLALRRYKPAKQIRTVEVRELTFVHKLMGESLHGKRRPAFAVLPSIDRYHELIRTIKEKANLSEDD
jgi:hypothetical protein